MKLEGKVAIITGGGRGIGKRLLEIAGRISGGLCQGKLGYHGS